MTPDVEKVIRHARTDVRQWVNGDQARFWLKTLFEEIDRLRSENAKLLEERANGQRSEDQKDPA